MAAQTGNTYISVTVIDSVEIPTAILGVNFDSDEFKESAPKMITNWSRSKTQNCRWNFDVVYGHLNASISRDSCQQCDMKTRR